MVISLGGIGMYTNGQSHSISVVVPTFNEADNVGHVLSSLPDGIDEVILVDGHSQDDTVEVAREARPDIRVVFQARRGKGNAMVAGFYSAVGDRIVAIDADGSMEPAEIPRYLQAMDEGAHYVRGSRFMDDGGSTDITPLRNVGNQALNYLANAMCRTRYTDLCYGFVAFRRSILDLMRFPDPFNKHLGRVWGDGFEIETLMAIRAAKAGLRVAEVPSFEADRMNGVSNLNTFRDGARCLKTLIAEGIAPRTMSRIPDVAPIPSFSTTGTQAIRDEATAGSHIPDVVPSPLLGSSGIPAVGDESGGAGHWQRISEGSAGAFRNESGITEPTGRTL
ncbi:glycosyltransferase family 2 protein [Citricoccus sp. NPDC055426]|uniref:glycosyltransferase family 2 protein n=1 Tax=Citricoccus sp. NPDC055426 TaxID=3155536 RepID=UPI0034491544